MDRKSFPVLLILCAALLTLGLWRSIHPPQAEEVLELAGATMGTRYSVKIRPGQVTALEALGDRLEAELARINGLMSTWQEDSELSRFNRSRAADWFEVSRDTYRVVAAAIEIGQATGGALDVTVGPLVDLWGFGPGQTAAHPPEKRAIRRTLERCGMGQLAVRADPPALRKSNPELEVDLSSIAKGFAVDRLGEILAAEGIDHYLVEIGGEIRASGAKSDETPWRVAVEKPAAEQRTVQQVIEIHNQGLATSGNYRNFFVADGQRYSHLINPRTGYPVPDEVASVSVLAASTMQADALATAFMIMGADATVAYADSESLAVLVIERTEAGFRERPSRAWPTP